MDCKLSQLGDPSLLRVPTEIDLWQARDDREALYVARLVEMMDVIEGSSRWTKVDVALRAMIWKKRLLALEYRSKRKGEVLSWSILVRFERRMRSLYGCIIGWYQRKVKNSAARSLYGRYVPLPSWWREWSIPCAFWAPLGPTHWYLGSRLKEDAGSPL